MGVFTLYEYRSLLVEGDVAAMVNSLAVHGWRVVSMQTGGFGPDGKFNHIAASVLLERPRPEVPQDPVPARGAAKKKAAG